MRGHDSEARQRPEAQTALGGVAIVIPAYNEGRSIVALVAACRDLPGPSRLIVVDDGSTDDTGVLAAAAGAELLRQPANRGKGDSLRRGLAAALAGGAHSVVTLDGDGQHRPEDIPRLLAAARAHPRAVVIGSRRAAARQAPRARRIANRVADFWISWAARQRIEDTQSGLRIYPAALAAALVRDDPRGSLRAEGFAFESAALILAGQLGLETVSVPVPSIYGPALRPSHFRPVADITRIVLMVAGVLLRRGMAPVGLWRALRRPAGRGLPPPPPSG